MAYKTVSQLKQSIANTLSGIDTNEITDLDGKIEKAARTLVSQVNIPEAVNTLAVTLYDDVYDYTAPTKIFGTSIIDFRPQGDSRGLTDRVYKRNREIFDRSKQVLPSGYLLSFEYDDGDPILRVSSPKPKPSVELDPIQDETSWTGSGSLSNLVLDETDYYEDSKAFRFLLTGSSTGILTKDITSQDISEYEDVGVAFLAVKMPASSTLTSITLRLGSSSTVYDEVTATTGHARAFTASKWMLIPFDFSGATSTGTPDWSAIDYAQIRINHTATMTNFRIGALFMSLPSPHELIYETAALFKATGGSPLQTITGDSDQILLNDPAYLLFEDVVALQIASDEGGGKASGLVNELRARLNGSGNDSGLYEKFRAENPSERLRSTTTYYNMRRIRK